MNDGHPADGNEGLFSSLIRKFTGKREDDVTEEEIMDMVNEGHEQGVLKENEAEMINNIFEFGEKQAQDVMIHRKNIIAIDSDSTVQEAFEFILDESFSRYPVYTTDIDNIIGILHIRDLLKIYVNEKNRDKKLSELKEQVLFHAYCIPETRNISLLFKEMQSKKVHIAVVVDEYGQTAGIVTMEDILEEIVGNILDEYDDEEEFINEQPDGTYVLDGQALLEDIEDALQISFECEDIDTINGYMIYKMGKIPEPDEQFETECGGYLFRVLKVENKMVSKVLVMKLPESEDTESEK
jgi:putative hemolysin